MDYEAAILARQEQLELAEDADTEDECVSCDYLSQCRAAAEGHGEWPHRCPCK